MSDVSDHYNARGLTPEMVAASFVAPPQFASVRKVRNTVIFGARGSGKTTLLRMLEPRAQVAWSHLTGEPVHDAIGVFVPVDASWLASLRQAHSSSATDDRWEVVAACVYTLAVVRAIVDVMIYRSKDERALSSSYGARISSAGEEKIAAEAAAILQLSERCLSLRDLRFRITGDLTRLPLRLAASDASERARLIGALGDPVGIAAAICDLFNVVSGDVDRRWALLCDEIEIAPEVVQQRLFLALRATPAPVILKMSLTPLVRGVGKDLPEFPMPGNDYDVETLIYSTKSGVGSKKAKDAFCQAIWEHLYSERFPRSPSLSPYRVLSEPVLVTSSRRRGVSQKKHGDFDVRRSYEVIFAELAKIDSSFKTYLSSKGIDAEHLSAVGPAARDAVVRKIGAIAELRLFYRSLNEGRLSGRTSLAPYVGASRLFDVSEGHPRWLKSTLGAMLDAVSAPESVSVAVQERELRHSVDRLVSRIRAAPPRCGLDSSSYGFLDRVGKFFANEVLGERFKADPYLSFVVDEAVSPADKSAIEDCLFIGALIPMVEEGSGLLHDGISGRRLRLSYWLSPHYHLPLITGRPVALSAILAAAKAASNDSSQLSLSIGFSNES